MNPKLNLLKRELQKQEDEIQNCMGKKYAVWFRDHKLCVNLNADCSYQSDTWVITKTGEYIDDFDLYPICKLRGCECDYNGMGR